MVERVGVVDSETGPDDSTLFGSEETTRHLLPNFGLCRESEKASAFRLQYKNMQSDNLAVNSLKCFFFMLSSRSDDKRRWIMGDDGTNGDQIKKWMVSIGNSVAHKVTSFVTSR